MPVEISIGAAAQDSAVFTTLLSVLGGAIIGGAITHLNSRYLTARQEIREDKDQRLAVAYSIAFKVNDAADNIVKIHRYAQHAKNIAGINQQPLWLALRELVSTERPRLSFSSDELALLATHKKAEWVVRLLELAALSNNLAALLREYNPKRETFGERAADMGGVDIEGETATFLTQSPHARLLAVRLEQLARHIEKDAREGAQEASKTGNEICALLREILDDPRFTLQFVVPAE